MPSEMLSEMPLEMPSEIPQSKPSQSETPPTATHTNRASSPAVAASQAQVDQLIEHINEQIELLALDDPDPALLRQMIRSLVDSRRAIRLRLIELLSQIGEPATPFLMEGLANHPESVVRKACCNALTNIGDPASVSGLVKALLADADIGVKSAAAGALAKVGAPAFEPLRQVLASETASESCKGHAAWAIASMSDEVSEQLYRHISDPEATVRTAMIGAIAQLVQKQLPLAAAAQAGANSPAPEIQKSLSILTEALSDSSAEVRIEAIANLARLDYQKAYQPLITCLRDSDSGVRKAAAIALAKLGNPEAIEALIPLQNDDIDPDVNRAAALAIEQLESKKTSMSNNPLIKR
ncbi:MAG: glycosyl transferase family 2 [Phormidesmis priestleyi]|uniref:Glycosyl transferase family 2 n=1 Tax=Phormidesmis priestleyi TaxID=268141 RepID=A0A2W4WMK9_9CYAN|nr:MAG: glycosyl transferase family 2 [Phormidesmis priestleyi]